MALETQIITDDFEADDRSPVTYPAIYTDSLVASDLTIVDHQAVVSDRIYVTDHSSTSQIERVTDSLEATDSTADFITTVVQDSITADDASSSLLTAHSSVTDSITAADQAQDVIVQQISDIIEISDSVAGHGSEIVSDSIVCVDDAGGAQTLDNSVSDSLMVLDGTYASQRQQIQDSIVVSDNVSAQARVLELVSDSAIALDLVVTRSRVIEPTVTDTIIADDSTASSGIFHDYVSDIIIVTDRVFSTNPNSIAWVMNVETGAPSFYTNYQFTSIVEHDGMLFAAASDGLYLLEGDNDGGTYIDAELKTGLLDFDLKFKKRLQYLYLGYTGGELEVDVETQAPGDIFTYGLEERDADAPRNNRIKLGKGLNDRYWRLTFRNLVGKDFQMYDTEAEIVVSKRRL
jgi:hypothetical protein